MHKVEFSGETMSDDTSMRVAGLCGSLRAGSFNQAALEAAGRLMPAALTLSIEPWAAVPIYCADEQEHGWPSAVLELGRAISSADAVLIASPEYNFGVPGGLKNVLDWLSRLPQQPLRGKPVALLGAATGPLGTARVQYELRRILHSLEARVLLKPEVFIANAKAKFDAEGRLVDETTLKFLGEQMQALQRWIVRERAAAAAEARLAQQGAPSR
jgi:chromate reductase, NAD(P)H dehydrogenase (quinone)